MPERDVYNMLGVGIGRAMNDEARTLATTTTTEGFDFQSTEWII